MKNDQAERDKLLKKKKLLQKKKYAIKSDNMIDNLISSQVVANVLIAVLYFVYQSSLLKCQ